MYYLFGVLYVCANVCAYVCACTQGCVHMEVTGQLVGVIFFSFQLVNPKDQTKITKLGSKPLYPLRKMSLLPFFTCEVCMYVLYVYACICAYIEKWTNKPFILYN